jgi:ubiquinone/menaquinone biosynthesis C-methylase UbiE
VKKADMTSKSHEKNFYERIKKRVYDRIVSEVISAEQIIDVGCGSCELAEFIARRIQCKVIGLDISNADFPAVVQKDRHDLAGLLNCVKGNAENLNSFRTNSIDAAISTYALHEFEHPLVVLKEIHRVLKSGACMVIVDFPRHSLAEQLWGERYFSKAEVEALLRKAGFKDSRVKLMADDQLLFAKARKTSSV